MNRQLLSTVSAIAFTVLMVGTVPSIALAQAAPVPIPAGADSKTIYSTLKNANSARIQQEARALGLDQYSYSAVLSLAATEANAANAAARATGAPLPNPIPTPQADIALKQIDAVMDKLAADAKAAGVILDDKLKMAAADEVVAAIKIAAKNGTLNSLPMPVPTPHTDMAIQQVKGAQDQLKADAAKLGIPANYAELNKVLDVVSDQVVKEVMDRYKLGYAIPEQIIPPYMDTRLDGVKEKAINEGLIKLPVVTITLPSAGNTITLMNGNTIDTHGLITNSSGRVVAKVTDDGKIVDPVTGKPLPLSTQSEWLDLIIATQECPASATTEPVASSGGSGSDAASESGTSITQNNSYAAATDTGDIYYSPGSSSPVSGVTGASYGSAGGSKCADAAKKYDSKWAPGRSTAESVGSSKNSEVEAAVLAIMGQSDPLKALAEWQKNYKAPYELNKYSSQIKKDVKAQVEDLYYTQLTKDLIAEWKAAGSKPGFDDWLRKQKKFDVHERSAIMKKYNELAKTENESIAASLLLQPDPIAAYNAWAKGKPKDENLTKVKDLVEDAVGEQKDSPYKGTEAYNAEYAKYYEELLKRHGAYPASNPPTDLQRGLSLLAQESAGDAVRHDVQKAAKDEEFAKNPEAVRRDTIERAVYGETEKCKSSSCKKAVMDAYVDDMIAWGNNAISKCGATASSNSAKGVTKPTGGDVSAFNACTGPAPMYHEYEKGGPKYPFGQADGK